MATTTIIGKVQSDGQVKYIRCFDREPLRVIARLLIMFYTRESRLDALLDLGNIYCLCPSPYGRSTGSSDHVHCIASIRDQGESEQDCKAEYITGKDIFLKANCPALLYDNGSWLFANHDKFIPINNPGDLPCIGMKDSYFLKYIRTSNDKERCKRNGDILDFSFPSWDAMCKQAVSDDDTYHIFRNGKLIKTINPKQPA